jgi:hypothetical protein
MTDKEIHRLICFAGEHPPYPFKKLSTVLSGVDSTGTGVVCELNKGFVVMWKHADVGHTTFLSKLYPTAYLAQVQATGKLSATAESPNSDLDDAKINSLMSSLQDGVDFDTAYDAYGQ